MKTTQKNNGSVILVIVFAIALLAALVIGILEINTEEIQLTQNQIYAAEALATAKAGLNDAFSEIRDDSDWTAGFTDKVFNGGSYTVTVAGSTVTSTGTSPQGFIAKVEADIGVGTNASSSEPAKYIITVNSFGINE